MEELLVITACLYRAGCEETTNQLVNQKPELRKFISKAESDIKTTLGPFAVTYAAPVVAFGFGASGNLTLTKTMFVRYNRTSTEFIFKKEF